MTEPRTKDIENELLTATGLKRPRSAYPTKIQEYLTDLAKETYGLKKKDWDGLSQGARDWYNDVACVAQDAKQDIPDFEEAEATPAEAPVVEAADEAPAEIAIKRPRRSSGGNGKADKPKAKPAKPVKAAKGRAKSGGTALTVEGLLRFGKKTNQEISDYVIGKGGQASPAFVGTCRSVVRATVEVMRKNEKLLKTAHVD